jgi:hypothetical protein
MCGSYSEQQDLSVWVVFRTLVCRSVRNSKILDVYHIQNSKTLVCGSYSEQQDPSSSLLGPVHVVALVCTAAYGLLCDPK